MRFHPSFDLPHFYPCIIIIINTQHQWRMGWRLWHVVISITDGSIACDMWGLQVKLAYNRTQMSGWIYLSTDYVRAPTFSYLFILFCLFVRIYLILLIHINFIIILYCVMLACMMWEKFKDIRKEDHINLGHLWKML